MMDDDDNRVGVEQTLAAWKQDFGAVNDADLARKLRIDRSAISLWKARGSIPKKIRDAMQNGAKEFLDRRESAEGFGIAQKAFAEEAYKQLLSYRDRHAQQQSERADELNLAIFLLAKALGKEIPAVIR